MSTILITGRIPELSIAELESLYGSKAVTTLGDHVLVDTTVDFTRLGGSIKAAKHLTTLETNSPQKAFDFCRKALPEHLQYIPDGKIKLGVSIYGAAMPLHKQNANVLSLKKVIKNAGRSVRAVPNTEAALTSAQTYHNALTSPVGLELIFVIHDGKTYIGQVTDVQDIDSYTLRDRGRPKRDAFVGMLPPKLAQTIINIATGELPLSASDPATSEALTNPQHMSGHPDETRTKQSAPAVSSDAHSDAVGRESTVTRDTGTVADTSESRAPGMLHSMPTILDPFCGTGVVLQEAALMKYAVYGTDISEKMIRFSRDNLNWAHDKFLFRTEWQLEIADATSHTWRQPIDAVAGEGYLGQPLGGQHPTPEKLAEIMHESLTVMRGFLKNIAPQLKSGTRLCIAIPAWSVAGKLHELDLAGDIESFGYAWIPFTHVDGTRLMYSRDDQTTHRHLLTLQKV